MKRERSQHQGAVEKGISQENLFNLASFRYEILRFLHFSKEAAEALELTSQQYQALLFIEGFSANGRMSIGELAERLFSRHHATVELVDRMEAAGLITRETEEWDRRRVYLTLTKKGEHKLQTLVDLHLKELSHSQLAKRLSELTPATIEPGPTAKTPR